LQENDKDRKSKAHQKPCSSTSHYPLVYRPPPCFIKLNRVAVLSASGRFFYRTELTLARFTNRRTFFCRRGTASLLPLESSFFAFLICIPEGKRNWCPQSQQIHFTWGRHLSSLPRSSATVKSHIENRAAEGYPEYRELQLQIPPSGP